VLWGRAPGKKESKLIEDNAATVILVDSAKTSVSDRSVSRSWSLFKNVVVEKSDMNDFIRKVVAGIFTPVPNVYIFFSTFGYVEPKYYNAFKNSSYLGFIYVADAAVKTGNLRVDVTNCDIRFFGKILNWQVRERIPLRKQIEGEGSRSRLVPLYHMVQADIGDLREKNIPLTQMIVRPHRSVIKDYSHVPPSMPIKLKLHDVNIIGVTNNKPPIHKLDDVASRLFRHYPFYLTYKLDGVPFVCFTKRVGTALRYLFVDKFGNVFLATTLDDDPIVAASELDRSYVEVIPKLGGVSPYFTMPLVDSWASDQLDIIMSRAMNHRIFGFKPHVYVDPQLLSGPYGRDEAAKFIMMPLASGVDGLIFIPFGGGRHYYEKGIDTYDVVRAGEGSDNNSSVTEAYLFDGKLSYGRMRVDKFIKGSRVDASVKPTKTHLMNCFSIRFGVVDKGRVKKNRVVVSYQINVGEVCVWGDYVWHPLQNNYLFLKDGISPVLAVHNYREKFDNLRRIHPYYIPHDVRPLPGDMNYTICASLFNRGLLVSCENKRNGTLNIDLKWSDSVVGKLWSNDDMANPDWIPPGVKLKVEAGYEVFPPGYWAAYVPPKPDRDESWVELDNLIGHNIVTDGTIDAEFMERFMTQELVRAPPTRYAADDERSNAICSFLSPGDLNERKLKDYELEWGRREQEEKRDKKNDWGRVFETDSVYVEEEELSFFSDYGVFPNKNE